MRNIQFMLRILKTYRKSTHRRDVRCLCSSYSNVWRMLKEMKTETKNIKESFHINFIIKVTFF
jgi:hypothetical protein